MGLDVANLLLKITGEPDDAKRALREITYDLHMFGQIDEHAKIDVDGYEAAKKNLDSLEESLTVLGSRDVTAKVKVNVDEAKARIKALRRELDLTASGGAGALPAKQIFGEVDKLGSELESTLHTRFEKVSKSTKTFFHSLFRDFGKTVKTAVVQGTQAAAGAAVSVVGATVEGAGAAAKGVVSLGASAVGAIGPLSALIGIILLFLPALAALTASLAGAVVGLGLLAIGFVGTLAPALLVVFGAVKELTQAWTAVTQQQEKAKQSALAVQQAQQGVKGSTEQLGSAQRNLREQTANAYEAWKQQIRSVREDLLGVQQAQLGIQSSELQYKQSLQALKEFRNSIGLGGGQFDDIFKKFTNVDFDPSKILKSIKSAGGGELGHKQDLELQQLILAVKEAKLGEAQAQNSLHSSNEKLEKDRRLEAKYLKEGIKAYPAYISALNEVESAQRGLASSERTLQKAQATADAPLKNVTKEQLAIGNTLHTFVNDLKKLFGPAVKEVFGGVTEGLKSVLSLLKDATLKDAFKELGRSIGQVFAQLGKTLASPEMRRNLTELVTGASQLVKVLGGQIMLNFIRLFTHLAVAAMPAMLKIVERVGGAFKRWADGSSDIQKLRSRISGFIREFEEWIHLIGALGRLIKAFFHDAAGQGDSLTRSLARTFEKWTAFLNTKAGQEEVKNFLKESISLAHSFIEVVKDLIEVSKTLAKVFGPIVEGVESVSGYLGRRFGEEESGEQVGEAREGQKRQQERLIEVASSQLKSGHDTKGKPLTPSSRKFLEEAKKKAEHELHPTKRSLGGALDGWGGGDVVPLLAERGEYVLRKEVASALGRPTLDRLNSTGKLPQRESDGRGDTYIDKIVLPATPGSTNVDPRIAAVKLGKELSRRGLG